MAFLTDYTQGQWAADVDDIELMSRVRNVTTGQIVNRFKGESAWSDAQRQVNDRALKDKFG